MSQRRRKHAHSSHERWLVSYADFITLLFAFFVVLYAASHVDKHKASALAAAIDGAFQSVGGLSSDQSRRASPVRTGTPAKIPGLLRTSFELEPQPGTEVPDRVPATETLADLKRELEAALGPEIRRRELAIGNGRDGLVISLREIGFFDSGSAALRLDAAPAFSRLASILAENDFHLRVEGHTDDVPIHNPKFASNWELSTARATETIRVLLTEFRLDPTRVSAAGYAEYHPAATNRTPAGRSLNRRVDIVVLAPASHVGTDTALGGNPSPPSP